MSRKDPNTVTFTWPMQQPKPSWWRRLIRLLVRR
jgi:hypothetical protein